jgi:hypothetical protein
LEGAGEEISVVEASEVTDEFDILQDIQEK